MSKVAPQRTDAPGIYRPGSWLDRYAGAGHDSVRANARREHDRLLVDFALTYFDREVRVGDLDRAAVQHSWIG